MHLNVRASARCATGACSYRGVRDRTCSARPSSTGVHSSVLAVHPRTVTAYAVAEPPQKGAAESSAEDTEFLDPNRPVRVLIAGGGIAGLVLAVALLKKGVDVRVFERDMTAIRGEGKYRGPIQVHSPSHQGFAVLDLQFRLLLALRFKLVHGFNPAKWLLTPRYWCEICSPPRQQPVIVFACDWKDRSSLLPKAQDTVDT